MIVAAAFATIPRPVQYQACAVKSLNPVVVQSLATAVDNTPVLNGGAE